MKKFVVCADIHGAIKSKRACDACIDFTRDFKPDITVIGGDLWDFSAIRTNADENDRSVSMREDYEMGAEFAKAFLIGKERRYLMLGNHDVRCWRLAESPDAVKADLAERMIGDIKALARGLKAPIVPYDSREGVVHIGHLKVIHGYHCGMSACATHARIYGNCVFGHTHSIESFQVPGLEQREARAIGCLCDLNPDYASAKTGKLRWANGWVAGFLFDNGTYQLNQIREVDGKFYASTHIKGY